MMARLSAALVRRQGACMRGRPANCPPPLLPRLLSSARAPPIPIWAPVKPGLIQRAAAEAAAAAADAAGVAPAVSSEAEERATSGRAASTPRSPLPPGAFARLPVVPLPAEHLSGATRRAYRGAKPAKAATDAVGGGTARRAAVQASQAPAAAAASRLDALAQAVCTPLGTLGRAFPRPAALHPFEAALLDLTLASTAGGSAQEGSGAARYERTLARLDAGRRAVLEAGKAAAAAAARSKNKAAAVEAEAAGREALAAAYAAKAAPPLDALREVAKALRRLPTVDAASPTLALVGAPNVGKSSLVTALSSGTPTVAAYPFTTRSVGVGHFYVAGARHQLTDTPGLLARPAADRNAMERLTLACLAHLRTAVVFVADPSGRCGSTPAQQWAVREELVTAFGGGGRPWVDVLSKADLVAGDLAAADARAGAGAPPPAVVETAADLAAALPGAVRVCTPTGAGLEELQAAIVGALAGGRAAGWMGERMKWNEKKKRWEREAKPPAPRPPPRRRPAPPRPTGSSAPAPAPTPSRRASRPIPRSSPSRGRTAAWPTRSGGPAGPSPGRPPPQNRRGGGRGRAWRGRRRPRPARPAPGASIGSGARPPGR